MFVRAGFNRRFKAICQARVAARGYKGPAYLIRFECGDLAWLYAGAVHWQAPAIFVDLIQVDYFGARRSDIAARAADQKPA
jgi:hypothetical protein